MFEQVVFAGGGHRCWWQAGFWDVVAPALALKPRLIAGVSAGAATACLLYANDSRTALGYYRSRLAGRPRNLYPANLWRRGQRLFPHEAIYREALAYLLGGPHFDQLRATAPEIRVQFARIPRWLGPRSAVAVGLLAYNLEKYALRSLHPSFGRRLGFSPEVVRVQDCVSDADLVSLLIASSCTPPFTGIEYRNGRPTIDGGMVDNVPVDALDDPRAPTLVLTTRRYPRHAPVFMLGARVYVQPSVKLPVSSWDYTAPHLYEATWLQGVHDGQAFLKGFGASTVARSPQPPPPQPPPPQPHLPQSSILTAPPGPLDRR
jgi:predicted acylesterase/phospholipase RssA